MTSRTQGNAAFAEQLGTVAATYPDLQRPLSGSVPDVERLREGGGTRTDVRSDAKILSTAEVDRSVDIAPLRDNHAATLFELLQKWEGVVQSRNDVDFTAILYDVTDRSRSEIEATFDLHEVSAGDLPLAVPGAVFRYQIGYETARGTKRTISEVQFKRIPPPTRAERIRARQEAARLADLLLD